MHGVLDILVSPHVRYSRVEPLYFCPMRVLSSSSCIRLYKASQAVSWLCCEPSCSCSADTAASIKVKERMIGRYALHVPENLPLDAAAPLMCAGITVWSPMQYYGLNKPGMKLGVVGLGGLGHMAVRFGKACPIPYLGLGPGSRRPESCWP